MGRSLRIGVDLDGPVYDFVGDTAEVVAAHRGVDSSTLPPATVWDFFTDWGLNAEEFWKIVDVGIADGRVWRHGEPIAGSVEAIRALRKAGHTIHIVTSRRAGSETSTILWLAEVGIEYDSLTFSVDKTIVHTDVFIDDYDKNLDALAEAGIVAIRYDAPYNAHATQHQTVKSWDEFVGFIEFVDNADEGSYSEVSEPAPSVVDEMLPAGTVVNVTRPKRVRPRRLMADDEIRIYSDTGGSKGSKPARFDLIPTRALILLAELYGKGADKYPPVNGLDNWRNGFPWSLAYAAAMRHLTAFWSGEDLDDGQGGTGLPHLTAVAWHCFNLVEYMSDPELVEEFDDRQDGRRKIIRAKYAALHGGNEGGAS